MISGPLIDQLIKEMQVNLGFVIALQRLRSWYFHNLEEDSVVTGVIWTPHITRARLFPDEKSVEEFKSQFISPRKVQILRITREQ